jgi:hypothetical protein
VLLDGAGLDVPGVPPHRLPPPAGLHHRAQEDLVEMISELPAHETGVAKWPKFRLHNSKSGLKKYARTDQFYSNFSECTYILGWR